MKGGKVMGWLKCVARCALLCGACGITPVPGDEFFGAGLGATYGAAEY